LIGSHRKCGKKADCSPIPICFEGEITVEAETKELAENQAYDRLSHLGQITVVVFKK
jgi:hypothetical protein